MSWHIDVWHVVAAASPYIGAWSAWMLGRSSRTHSSRYASLTGSGTSGTAPVMHRRLGRTPLLRRRGLIRARRYTR